MARPKTSSSLPNLVYVVVPDEDECDEKGLPFLNSGRTMEDVVGDGDEATVVGTYKLIETARYRIAVKVVKDGQ